MRRTHYRDIEVHTDQGGNENHLIATLHMKLHRRLVTFGVGAVAISLPAITKTSVGPILRLHADDTTLRVFGEGWVGGLKRWVTIGPVRLAPSDVPHMEVHRVRYREGTPARARRYAARHDVDIATATALLGRRRRPKKRAPFIWVDSQSTGQRMPLHMAVRPSPDGRAGDPDSYGLGAAVPSF